MALDKPDNFPDDDVTPVPAEWRGGAEQPSFPTGDRRDTSLKGNAIASKASVRFMPDRTEVHSPIVHVPLGPALGFGASGCYDGDLGVSPSGVIDVVRSPDLGADSRFLYPRLTIEAIERDATSVASYGSARARSRMPL